MISVLMANTDSDIDLLPLFHFMLQIQTNGVVEKVFELAERNFMRFASAKTDRIHFEME